jgi:hypothetical protein
LPKQIDEVHSAGASLSQKPQGWRSKLINKLFLILFGVLLGAILAEVALRIAGYSYPEFYQPDASRGYGLRPNMEGWYRKEGEAYVRINSDGLRDREHTKTKPANTVRIALLGDSYPEGFQVAMEDTFWKIMERKLTECGAFGGQNIEVINFGVSGYGTAQELLTLREHVWQYSPDIVLLTVITNNDITDNVQQLKKTDAVPYFLFRDGKLTLDDSFRNTRAFRMRQSAISRLGRWVRDHSRVIQAINHAHHGFKIWLASRRARQANANASLSETPVVPGEELGIDNLIYREPSDQTWNEAWRVTEALIREMGNEVQARGARFFVVTLSNGIQIYPQREARENFIRRLGASDLFYPDKRIKQVCESEHIPALILAPRLQEYAERNRVFLHGFGDDIGNGHWNQTGHRVAGEMIAASLCSGDLK